jgi:hypothetical protein
MGKEFESGGGSLIFVWVRFNLSHRIRGSHLLAKEMGVGAGSYRKSKSRNQCNEGHYILESEDRWILENDLSEWFHRKIHRPW